ERFVIVLTQERGYAKAPLRFPAFYRSWFRRYPALADALLTRWKRYNETRERIFELEREGKAHVFAPERMPVGNGTRDLSRLAAAHRLGLSQARRELPAIQIGRASCRERVEISVVAGSCEVRGGGTGAVPVRRRGEAGRRR